MNSKEYILEIYDDYFPNSHNEYEVAESDYLIAKMDYDKVVLETEVNIREAYFNLLEKKKRICWSRTWQDSTAPIHMRN